MRKTGIGEPVRSRFASVVSFFAIIATACVAIAGGSEPKYSPLFAYRHKIAVASMLEDPMTPAIGGGGEDPTTPASANPGSLCLGSLCFGSLCLGSGCLGSLCVLTGCTASATCGATLCVGSICAGSACVMSACGLSACAMETSCLRECLSPVIPIDPEPQTWQECTFGICRLQP